MLGVVVAVMMLNMTRPAVDVRRGRRGVSQFTAVLVMTGIALSIAVAATFGFSWLVARKLPWQLAEQTAHVADVVKLAFAVVAGLGGVVALVVAYRRQRTLEQDAAGRRDQVRLLTERFGSAAEQLGSTAAPVRLAGVYAMAALADEWEEQRQQCIDVLCGYLRLPYVGDPGAGQPSTIVSEHTWPAGIGSGREILTYDLRAGEKEVRQSIFRVVARRLHQGAAVSWSDKNFDFGGVLVEDLDLRGGIFAGELTSFRGATFTGKLTSFRGATFSAQRTSFGGATFASEVTSFGETRFSGDTTWFDDATFASSMTWFEAANFCSDRTLFDNAAFAGEATSFDDAVFAGLATGFDGAIFSGQITTFDRATFSGGTTAELAFRNTVFRGVNVRWGPVPPR